MKKTAIIILFIISTLFVYGQKEYYYWYKGEKVYLKENKSKRFVLLKNIESEYILNQRVGNTWHVEKFKKENSVTTLNAYNNKSTQQNLNWAILETTNKSDIIIMDLHEIIYDAPFFKSSQNQDIGLSHLFYVKLNKIDDLKILEELSLKHNVEIIGSNKFMPLWYTLSCTKCSTGNALTMANLFYETGLFSASEPDLMVDDILNCVDDTFFNNQWNLNNTGQNGGSSGIDIDICDAWEITMGCDNVVVAVLDHGIEMNHPNLLNISPLSFDTESGTSPSLVLGSHGTACAGIIGASADNNIGIAGVAPNCQLMSISNSLAGTPNSRQRRADGINFAWENGADVISNSWGSGVQYQIIDDAINNALNNGRNGLGCIVVFATGNENGNVNYPANSNSDIIAVGAMSMCGERKNPNSCDGENWGSNYGLTLDVVAPGVLIPTTDRQGSAGYNTSLGTNGNYHTTFNGTSSATPHVAGIATLILSANPNLTHDQVRDLIESSCDKVGGYSYTTTSGRTNGTWNNEMGYGKVNAYKALTNVYPISGPTTVCTSNSTFTLNRPSGATINWTKSSNLSYVSGQGTNNYTVKAVSSSTSGAGWVEAGISVTGCGDITVSKDFWVGKPSIAYTGTSGSCYEPTKIYKGPIIDGINYTWSVNNPDINLSASNHVCYIDADIPDGSSERYTLTLTISGNNCTTSNTISGLYHKPTLCDCGYNHPSCGGSGGPPGILSINPNFLSVKPNPANDYIEAEILDENFEHGNNNKIHVKLFNNRSIPVYTGNSHQKTFQINTSNLPHGLYLLQIIYKGEKYSKQVLIEH